jgi:hypothetical protein
MPPVTRDSDASRRGRGRLCLSVTVTRSHDSDSDGGGVTVADRRSSHVSRSPGRPGESESRVTESAAGDSSSRPMTNNSNDPLGLHSAAARLINKLLARVIYSGPRLPGRLHSAAARLFNKLLARVSSSVTPGRGCPAAAS